MHKRASNKQFVKSCGNVFKDLGLPNPRERLQKAMLLRQAKTSPPK